MKRLIIVSLAFVAALTSCNKVVFQYPEGESKLGQDYEKAWIETFGVVSSDQTWIAELPVTKSDDPALDKISEAVITDKWTVCFEDLGTIGDFDFNDVVVAIVTKDTKADYYLCAVGGTITAELYINGSPVGEVHEIMGVTDRKNMVNSFTKNAPFVSLGTYDFTSIEDAVEGIALKTNNGKEERTIAFPKKGEIPAAFCVPGLWAWPKENTSVREAYSVFESWSKDPNQYNNTWFLYADERKVVGFLTAE